MGLSDGLESFRIRLAVLIQYPSVTDTQPATQPRCRSYCAQRSGVEPKKRSDETQTLRAGCSKAQPKLSPRRRPLPGGAGRSKFNQLETVTTFTYRPSLVKTDARNFELSW